MDHPFYPYHLWLAPTHHPSGWGKIFVIKEAMDKYPDAEWIFNTDCDVMITNMDVKLEDIVKDHAGENTNIIIPADCNGIGGNFAIIGLPPALAPQSSE